MTISNEALGVLTGKQLKRGVYTNVLSPLRADDNICSIEFDGGLLLFISRPGFTRLKLFLQQGATLPMLPSDGVCVTELVYRDGDERTEEVAAMLKAQGFHDAMHRIFLRRKGDAPDRDDTVVAAGMDLLEPLFALLTASFPPHTGCLPTQQELAADIASGAVFAAMQDGRVAGLLHSDLSGTVPEIRHMAVSPEFRRQGVSTSLLRAFLHRTGGVARVWTNENNPAAIGAYEKFGFTPAGRRSIVLLREK